VRCARTISLHGSFAVACLVLVLVCANYGRAQKTPSERSFPQSKVAVEKALHGLQSSIAGRLPILDGFAVFGDRPMGRFQRGYYQCRVEVNSAPAGGSVVWVSAKITAWYADPTLVHSGYQVLASNGRLETDLLDQLQDALEGTTSAAANREATSKAAKSVSRPDTPEPTINAPMPRIPDSALGRSVVIRPPAAPDASSSLKNQTDAAEKHEQELAAEAKNLEEILQNQAHPDNLVAVKKTGTPVLQSARGDAPVLFSATAGDEFEILDTTSDWVHIRISGLSRGWLQRSSVEMPEGSPSDVPAVGRARPPNAVPFRVSSEQFAPFPGDWAALRGKTVRIVSVQKTNENANAKDTGSPAKLEFARAVFDNQFAKVSAAAEGIVLIFDSEDGGMVAATAESLKKWKAGALSDDAFWHQCFFDPPEIFAASTDH
jgi:hypothetical protein